MSDRFDLSSSGGSSFSGGPGSAQDKAMVMQNIKQQIALANAQKLLSVCMCYKR